MFYIKYLTMHQVHMHAGAIIIAYTCVVFFTVANPTAQIPRYTPAVTVPVNVPIFVSEGCEFLVALRVFLEHSDVAYYWPCEWTRGQSVLSS